MQSHFAEARVKDSTLPCVKIVIDNSAPVPSKIFKLGTPSDFRISRTYCARAVASKYRALGPLACPFSLYIYSTRPTAVRVHVSSLPQPLQPGESCHLSKRMDAQCESICLIIEMVCMVGVRRQQRRRKQRKQINADRSSSSDSSTESDGTSSTES